MNVESRKGCVVEEVQVSISSTSDQSNKLDDPCKNQPILQNENNAVEPPLTDFPNEMNRYLTSGLKDNLGDSPIPARNAPSDRSQTCNVAIMRRLEDTVSVIPFTQILNLFERFSWQLLFKTFQLILSQSVPFVLII